MISAATRRGHILAHATCQYFEDIRISFTRPWLCVSGPAPRMSESGRIDIEMGQSVMQHPGFVKIIYETRKEILRTRSRSDNIIVQAGQPPRVLEAYPVSWLSLRTSRRTNSGSAVVLTQVAVLGNRGKARTHAHVTTGFLPSFILKELRSSPTTDKKR